MNIDEYEKKHRPRYIEFAATVRSILQQAISASGSEMRLQSIQDRAKDVDRLRARLEEKELLESQSIETERRDLAGVRLIFYTNTDVDRFQQSRLIAENFDIERGGTRVHHPVAENDESQYRAIHYTVRLTEARTNLPEYARFKDMRCEVQIHTILNHAWSETGHDLIYKNQPKAEGVGHKALERIEKRLKAIMDNYLLRAGYEFQKVQHDAERLRRGKELFDREAVESLALANNNNERHEWLSSIKEYVIPIYDDIPGIYRDLEEHLLAAARAARATRPEPIKTAFGDLPGKTAADVVNLIVTIFDSYRYADIEVTFAALCVLWRDEIDAEVQKHILDAVENLAHYDLDVYEKAGLYVQEALIALAGALPAADRSTLAPVLIVLWRSVLHSGIRGATWRADSVTLRNGALPVCDELKAIRRKAIDGLLTLFAEATSEDRRRRVVSALDEAKRLPIQATYGDDLLALTLHDAAIITDFLTENSVGRSYELLEHLEHVLLFDYRRACAITSGNRVACRPHAERLMRSIEAFRDRINTDPTFVRYKTLVGYESVFPQQWDNDNFDYQESEAYRKEQSAAYIASITPESEDEWFALIERCAATKSNDLATFPHFGAFLVELAKVLPAVADRYLDAANADLLIFLPAFLRGLFQSEAVDTYQRRVQRYLDAGTHLSALARHWRNVKPNRPEIISAILSKSIAAGDENAVIECMVFAIDAHGAPGVPANMTFLVPALTFLTERKNANWIHGVWFLDQARGFLDSLSENDTMLVLDNFVVLPSIGHEAERLLGFIASKYPAAVWDCFGKRLNAERDDDDNAL